MREYKVRMVNDCDDPILHQLPLLFDAMYDEFIQMGIILNPVQDAADRWINALRNTLGRFGALLIAVEKDDLVGFAHGALSMAPDYLDAGKIGVITHIFVTKEARGKGLAIKMVKELENWFRDKGVHSVELQVLSGNYTGITFWEKSGYSGELIQYRKLF